jgi:small nuclear ribonucleoprotein (snRNP)-like protein
VLAYSRLALRRRVIVNLKTGEALAGVLTRKSGPLLELRNVELHEAGRPPVKMDGAVVVERGNVSFVQVVGEV